MKPARVADLAELAALVVEAEDQRADRALRLAGAPAHDDGVDRAHALDLDHADALARLVGRVGLLGDDALGLLQPMLGLGRGAHHRRQLDGLVDERLERGAALEVRQLEQHVVVAGEQVEGDERAGVFSASIATRDFAGWMRWPSRSNSWPPTRRG